MVGWTLARAGRGGRREPAMREFGSKRRPGSEVWAGMMTVKWRAEAPIGAVCAFPGDSAWFPFVKRAMYAQGPIALRRDILE